MKRYILAFTLVLLSGSAFGRETVERIVAVVNRGVVTQNELQTRIKAVEVNLQRQGVKLPDNDTLRRQVLERLIVERLQLEYAKQSGIRIDDNQLDKALDRIAQQNKMTREQLMQAIQQQGLTPPAFREQIRNEIILTRLREREVDSRVTVSEAEVDAFLKQQKGNQSSEFHLAHILVQLPEEASNEVQAAKRKKAEEALAALEKGEAFNSVAAKYSDAKDALDGGDLGWRNTARLPDLFVQAARSLKAGQYSPLLKSPNGFHIVQLIEERGGSAVQEVTKTRARHILIKTGDLVTEAEAKVRIDQVHERLKHGAKFEELARVYSEDTSASRGGDLGWIGPGDTVPDFEQTLDATEPGQISEPVKTPFGWHIIQVLERKKENVGPERERLQAKMELRAKRADDLYDEWVRQLRDSSYVDIRL